MRLGSAPLTALLVTCAAGVAPGATLERLSMDEMVAKSTDIVRGRVTASTATVRTSLSRSGIVYTAYTIEVAERWKGAGATRLNVAVPGGAAANGIRQTFPGAPELAPSAEYVFFLWTGRSGLTQIIGLSQGLMNLVPDVNGKLMVSRPASAEPMVDRSGNPVVDRGFAMTLAEFRTVMSRYGLPREEK